jgi:hypothetical protein
VNSSLLSTLKEAKGDLFLTFMSSLSLYLFIFEFILFFLFSELSWMVEFHKYVLKTRFCLVDVTLVYFVLYGRIWVCWFLFPYELINLDWKLSSSSFFI